MQNNLKNILDVVKQNVLEKEEIVKDLSVDITYLEDAILHIEKNDYKFTYSEDLFKKIVGEKYAFVQFMEALEILSRFNTLEDEQVLKSKKIIEEILSIYKKSLQKFVQDLEEKKHEFEKDYEELKKYQILFINLPQAKMSENELEKLIVYLYKNGISKDDIKNVVFYINVESQKVDTEIKSDTELPQLTSSEVEEIELYINKYNSLSLEQKKTILSASILVQEGYINDLKGLSYVFSDDEILYYASIYLLIDPYSRYKKDKDDMENIQDDRDLKEIVVMEVNDIRSLLEKIHQYEEKINDEELLEEVTENQNLAFFLTTNENPIDDKEESVITYDVRKIESKNDGNVNNDMDRILRLLNNKLIGLPVQELRSLGPKINKNLNNGIHNEYPLFDTFNIYCLKGSYNNPSRITYMTMSVSENNKQELIERYNIKLDSNIYLVLGIFTKKNDDSEYVRITHNRLIHEEKQIKMLMEMLKKDFTDDTRKKVFSMLDDSLGVLSDLNSKYLLKGEMVK